MTHGRGAPANGDWKAGPRSERCAGGAIVGLTMLGVTSLFAVLLIGSPETTGRGWLLPLLLAVGATGAIAGGAVWSGRRSPVVVAALVVHAALCVAWMAATFVSPTAYAFPVLAWILVLIYRGRNSKPVS